MLVQYLIFVTFLKLEKEKNKPGLLPIYVHAMVISYYQFRNPLLNSTETIIYRAKSKIQTFEKKYQTPQ